MIKISNYLDEKLVFFLSAENRDETLCTLANNIDAQGTIQNKQAFYESLLERERVVSTGIGMGVAITHAKMGDYDHFFIAIGILSKGVEWNSLDNSLVRIIFMIGGPDDKQTEYLQILSALTLAIKDEEKRKKMLTLNSPQAIISLFGEN